MKFNLTHAIGGVALLVVLYKLGKRSGEKASVTKPADTLITQPGQWWSYAGAWGGSTS